MSGKTKLDVVKDGLVAYFDGYSSNSIKYADKFYDINNSIIVAENISNAYEKKYKDIGRIDFLTAYDTINTPQYDSVGKYWSFFDSDYLMFSPENGINFNTPTTFSTISFWLKVIEIPSLQSVVLLNCVEPITDNIWYMQLEQPTYDTIFVVLVYDDGITPYTYPIDTRINTGQWLNICYVNIGQLIGKSNLYVNGVLLDNNVEVGYTNQQYPKYIGTNVDANANFFYGDISNFMIYNRALSNSEVLQNYNAIKYRFGL
jgi:hypothetical protein